MKTQRAADFWFRGPSLYKTFGELRRMESLGEWRSSGVLLHQPFGEEGHPGKVGPSVGINLPKVVLWQHMPRSLRGYQLPLIDQNALSDILACVFTRTGREISKIRNLGNAGSLHAALSVAVDAVRRSLWAQI
jgi:hypothetical protein